MVCSDIGVTVYDFEVNTFTIATVRWRIINLVLRISQLTLTSTTHLKESQKILSMFQRRKPNKKIAKEV